MNNNPQTYFKVGPGIIFVVPITRIGYLSDNVYSLKLNTCKTHLIIKMFSGGNYNKILNALKENITNNSEIKTFLDEIQPIIQKLFIILQKNDILSTIQKTSENSKCFCMNFVGYRDFDQMDTNKNEGFQLIKLFLNATGKKVKYMSRNLPVLINNDGNPGRSRDLSMQEILIISSLISYFKANNFPFIENQKGNIESFIIQDKDINSLDNFDVKNESKIFSLLHYIQSLFTSIMILYIDESPQTRGIIFENFQNLLGELESEQPWTNEKQPNEAVNFLIEKIFFNAQLIQQVNFESIKTLTAGIYQSLEMSDHVTQMEFIKFLNHENSISDGFMTKDGYFYLPLLNLLTAFSDELELNIDDPIFKFFSKIDKHISQLRTNNLEIASFKNEINNEDWNNSLLDFDNMNAEQRIHFISQYDKDIQDLLNGISVINLDEINNLSNQSFQYIPSDKLSNLSSEEQFQVFFNNCNDRLRYISRNQLKAIKSETFSLLNNAVKQKQIDFTNFNDFIRLNGMNFSIEQLLMIDFENLNNENQKIFLILIINCSKNEIQKLRIINCQSEILTILIEKRLNDLSDSQIHDLFLPILGKKPIRLIVEHIIDKLDKNQIKDINLSYFNDDEKISIVEKKLQWMTEQQLLTIYFPKIKEKNPEIFNNTKKYIYEHSSDQNSNICFLYLFYSQKFEINDSVIQKMPEGFKLVYLNNHADSISEEYQHSFLDSVKNIFENPSFYRNEIFSIIINNWDHKLISPLIKHININEFPIIFLSDLIKSYSDDITLQQLNSFPINNIILVENTEKRYFIFEYFMNKFMSNNRFDIIRTIKIQYLSQQELDLLLEKSCKYLVTDQVIKIDLTKLNHHLLVLLLNEKILSMLANQITMLDCSNSEIAHIIIQSGRSYYLNESQIKSFNFNELNAQEDIKKLINEKINMKFIFEYLSDDQIKLIEINLIRNDALKDFLKSKGHLLTEKQVQQITFKKNKKNNKLNIQILGHLNNANKLEFLGKQQVKNLVDIFESQSLSEIQNIFKSKEFALFFTNNQTNQINDKIIQTLNLNSIEPHFLIYLIKRKINLFLPNQIELVDFSVLDKVLINAWFEKLPNLDSEKITEKSWNTIIAKKVENLPTEMLHEIMISHLDIKILLIILNKRINDLSISQIHDLDTSNIIIAKELINKKFHLLNEDQKFKIPLSKLDTKDQAVYISQLVKNCAFDLSSVDENEIQNINIINLKQYKNEYFSLLISDKLSEKQFMMIDWMENDEFDRNEIALVNFLKKKLQLSDDNYQYLSYALVSQSIVQIDMEKFESSPIAYKVAFLNTKILNFQPIHESLIKFFVPEAIKIIFQYSCYYKKTVQFVINEWNDYSEPISKFINILTIQNDFSEQTITNLLNEKYLMYLSVNQIQSFNLSKIQSNVIEYALINRAPNFLKNQIINSNCQDKDIISNQLSSLKTDKKIASLNLIDLHIILLSFILNKKFNLITDEKINDLVKRRIKELKKEYVIKIKLNLLAIDSLSHLLRERMEDITENQFLQLSANILNKLNTEILLVLLSKFQKIIPEKMIKDLNVSNPNVAAFIFINYENYLSSQQFQSMNLNEVSKITQEKIGKKVIDIIREKKRYKDLSIDQLNQLDFKDFINVKFILECKRENEISVDNCKLINLAKIDELNNDLQINLFQACSKMFTEKQIHDLEAKNINKFIKIIISNDQTKYLKKVQVRKIIFSKLQDEELSKLIIDRLHFFSRTKMNNLKVVKILNNQNDNEVLATLGNEKKIKQFCSYHIKLIKITSAEVATRLIIYHCSKLSVSQIHSISLDDWDIINIEIKKRKNSSILNYLIQNKIIHYLNDQQFNKFIDYSNSLCIKEIIEEKIEKRITSENALKINLMNEFANLSSTDFMSLFRSCYLKFSKNQIGSLKLTFLKDDIDLLVSLLINRLSYLTKNQMNEEIVINTIKNLKSKDILSMINNEHNKQYIQSYHINHINILSDINVAQTLIGFYPTLLTKEQIKSLNLDVNQLILDINGNKISILDVLISNNRLIDLTANQLNSFIDFTQSKYVIEVLKQDLLLDNIFVQNVQKINLTELYGNCSYKQYFLNFLNKYINEMSDTQINDLDTSNIKAAKLIQENNLFAKLSYSAKAKFNVNELIYCNYSQLSHFFIFGKGDVFDVANGIILFKYFKEQFADNEKEKIKEKLTNISDYRKFNEIYFAKCVICANHQLKEFPFDEIANNFFKFFDELEKSNNFYIFDYMKCKVFDNDCKAFKVSPFEFNFIMKTKYKYDQHKELFKQELSRINSFTIFDIFNCNSNSPYRAELKKVLESI